MPIAIIIALLLAGGVTVGAERAHPGNALYPVKTQITEKVAGAVRVSEKANASWQAELADRRLKEAEELASVGKLDAKALALICAQFEFHKEKVDASIKNLALNKENAARAEVMEDWKARLKAHENALVTLSQNSEGKSKEELDGLLTYVRTKLWTSVEVNANEDGIVNTVGGEIQFHESADIKEHNNSSVTNGANHDMEANDRNDLKIETHGDLDIHI